MYWRDMVLGENWSPASRASRENTSTRFMSRANNNYGEQTLGKCKRTCGFIERTKYQGLHCRNMYPNNFTDTFTIYLNDILENLNQNKEDIIDFIKACHSNTLSLIFFFLNLLHKSAFLDNFNTYFKRE